MVLDDGRVGIFVVTVHFSIVISVIIIVILNHLPQYPFINVYNSISKFERTSRLLVA